MLWLSLSFLDLLCIVSFIFLYKIISLKIKNNFDRIISLLLILSICGFISICLLGITYFTNKKELNINNLPIKLILISSIIILFTQILHMLVYSLSPNIAISNAILNSNLIFITLLSYFYFNQKLNIGNLIGIIITFIGLITLCLTTFK